MMHEPETRKTTPMCTKTVEGMSDHTCASRLGTTKRSRSMPPMVRRAMSMAPSGRESRSALKNAADQALSSNTRGDCTFQPRRPRAIYGVRGPPGLAQTLESTDLSWDSQESEAGCRSRRRPFVAWVTAGDGRKPKHSEGEDNARDGVRSGKQGV